MTRRTAPTRRAVAGALAAVVVLAGCTGARPDDDDKGSVVPDEEIYAAIAEIPGVTDVSITFQDDLTTGPLYGGELYVDATADPLCVLDLTLGYLRYGKPGARSVAVVQGDEDYVPEDLGDIDYAERYGPTSKDGTLTDPGTPPACQDADDAAAAAEPEEPVEPDAGGDDVMLGAALDMLAADSPFETRIGTAELPDVDAVRATPGMDGAVATALLFVEAWHRASQSGDTALLDAIADPACVFCSSVRDAAAAPLGEDLHLVTTTTVDQTAEPSAEFDQTRVQLGVQMDVLEDAGTVDGVDHLTTHAGSPQALVLSLRQVEGRWTVTGGATEPWA